MARDPEKRRVSQARYRESTREQASARTMRWQRANPEKYRLAERAARLRRVYGLTPEQYDAMGSVCQICGAPPTRRRLDIDHDHKTGEIRGLLCFLDNRMLGLVRGGDPALLLSAHSYMTKRHTGLFVPKKKKRKKKK